MEISRISPFTGKTNTMDVPVTQEQLDKYATGDYLIQDVFPDLTANEREFIMTGTTPEDWDKYIGGATDEDGFGLEETIDDFVLEQNNPNYFDDYLV